MTTITGLNQIFTRDEVKRARTLYGQLKRTGRFAKRIEKELIQPNISRINKHLGQDNDPKYLAYCVEYNLSQAWSR